MTMATMAQKFTVVAILALTAGILFLVFIPERVRLEGQNAQRKADLASLVQSLEQYKADHLGDFPLSIPSQITIIGSKAGQVNICPLLVPQYRAALPSDPTLAEAYFLHCGDFVTGYSIFRNDIGQLILSAPAAELSQRIEIVVQ